jgi:hypothetical protein
VELPPQNEAERKRERIDETRFNPAINQHAEIATTVPENSEASESALLRTASSLQASPPLECTLQTVPSPNEWLGPLLTNPTVRHDWFTCLTYSKMAEHFGNSSVGKFGPATCWFIRLGNVQDIRNPGFKGIFLTEKGSVGFLNDGVLARFYNGMAFFGTQESTLEGIGIFLTAIGLDAHERLVFFVSEDYRAKFGVAEKALQGLLQRLRAHGSVITNTSEALSSPEPLKILWTIPVEQVDPKNPEVLESTAPF